MPDILAKLYQHALGTPREIVEQQFMDFTPGFRLMPATEIPTVRQQLHDFYGVDDMFDVQSKTPFLADYSSNYFMTEDRDGGIYYLDHVEGSSQVARNMEAFLNTVLACYRQAAYFADDEGWLDTDGDLEDQVYSELNPEFEDESQ